MFPLRQLKCVVGCGFTPAPVLPVMALITTSPFKTPCLSQRQQRELYAGGKTSRIGYVLCLGYERAMGFGQTINVIVSRSCYSEILSKVYDFYVRGHGIVFKRIPHSCHAPGR